MISELAYTIGAAVFSTLSLCFAMFILGRVVGWRKGWNQGMAIADKWQGVVKELQDVIKNQDSAIKQESETITNAMDLIQELREIAERPR